MAVKEENDKKLHHADDRIVVAHVLFEIPVMMHRANGEGMPQGTFSADMSKRLTECSNSLEIATVRDSHLKPTKTFRSRSRRSAPSAKMVVSLAPTA
jgi:hypothetical protein